MATLATRSVVDDHAPSIRARRVYPWIVFLLTFGLLLSDYMSRQVLSAVFPFLKAEWALSDTQLGSLTSVVALAVGILAVPLSLLADRWGRVRAIVLMAVVWSVATAASAFAAGYDQLLLSRVFIGVGEAAYGSVGLAVVLAVFPAYRRAAFTGALGCSCSSPVRSSPGCPATSVGPTVWRRTRRPRSRRSRSWSWASA